MVAEKTVRLNEEISAPEVRLLGVDGEQIGVVSIHQAQQMAIEAELDLVEIAPQAKPPVCRIMDYGKFVFEEGKRKATAKKKQKQIQIKEVKFRPGTDESDYQIKLRSILRFLEEGDKAKITLRFRGREFSHPELGKKLLERLELDIGEHGLVEQSTRLEGRQMIMIIAPKKKPGH